MSEQPPSEVLGALPRSRPHRRSRKRPDRATPEQTSASSTETNAPAAKAPTARGPAATAPAATKLSSATSQRSTAATRRSRAATAQKARRTEPEPRDRPAVLGTAVQIAAELTEIGLSAGARAIRGAVSRLPRP